jgi:uncharacterized protein (DUF1800 family)
MSVKSLAKPAFPASLERIRSLAQRPRRRPQAPSQLGPPGLPVEFPVPGVLPAMAAGPAGLRRPHADALSRLVDRITQGFNAAEHARARTLGYEAYLEEQLDHLAIDDSAMDARLAGLTTLVMSPKQILDNFPMEIRTPYTEIKGAALLRSVFSRRQLYERMVEFWNDHFNLDHNKSDFLYVFKPEDDRLVVRPNALGSFPTLLSASAHGAAMLFYLDNWLNIAGAPQENYARELMELHTLGVGGGYTEQDVREVAECFTGWTLNGDTASANYLRALYEPSYHQGGNKVVLGVTIPATPGRDNAQHVLDILTAHPSTAQFLSRKMIRWLLTETPPQSLVDQVAETYLDTAGDIKSMIRVILAKPNLERASPVFAPKYRRPFHLMTSLLRGLGAEVTGYTYALYYLATMGHSPFDWSPPDGYPDKVEAWGHSLLPRWTFNSHLMQGYVYGVELPLFELLEQLDAVGPNAHIGLAHRINRQILGGALSPEEEYMVQYFVNSLAAPLGWNEVYEAIALAASMPGYQWY